MLSLYDEASMDAALASPLEPQLRKLLVDRIHDARATGLIRMTHFLVVEPGDGEEAILEEIGMSPLTNPLDGARFGSDEFEPWWDYLETHRGYHEMVICVGNSGWAAILLIEDADGIIPELLRLCRTYATELMVDIPEGQPS